MPKTTKSKAKSSKKAGAKASTKTKKKAAPRETAEALEAAAPQGETSAHKSEKAARKAAGQKAAPRPPLTPKTYFTKWGEGQDKWRLIDATGQPLGRLSSYIAKVLMGKDKPTYTRFSDTGDHVIVINAKSVVLTGNKWADKEYNYHTNYPGGIKTFTAKQLLAEHPERLVERAVYGMLPKGHMGRRWFKKLRVFSGSEHPHKAQQPQQVTLPDLGAWERT